MWVARDKDGCLSLFWDKPVRDEQTEQWLLSNNSTEVNYLREEDCQFKITWEDEPIEISLIPTSFFSEVNHLTDAICGSTIGIPEGMTNGDVLVSMKKINEQLKGICG